MSIGVLNGQVFLYQHHMGQATVSTVKIVARPIVFFSQRMRWAKVCNRWIADYSTWSD